MWDSYIMQKQKKNKGLLIREFTNTKVSCTCGKGNLHSHPSGSGMVIIPLA